MFSCFAAAQAADEEVEASEGDRDQGDYSHGNASFGAGEDGLVLRKPRGEAAAREARVSSWAAEGRCGVEA